MIFNTKFGQSEGKNIALFEKVENKDKNDCHGFNKKDNDGIYGITRKFVGLTRNLWNYKEISGITKKFAQIFVFSPF